MDRELPCQNCCGEWPRHTGTHSYFQKFRITFIQVQSSLKGYVTLGSRKKIIQIPRFRTCIRVNTIHLSGRVKQQCFLDSTRKFQHFSFVACQANQSSKNIYLLLALEHVLGSIIQDTPWNFILSQSRKLLRKRKYLTL